MQINIPISETESLVRHATAAGFDSVENYVTEFVRTLARHPSTDKLFAPLSEDELAASLAMIDRGMAEIDAGKGMSLKEARRHSRENLRAGDQ